MWSETFVYVSLRACRAVGSFSTKSSLFPTWRDRPGARSQEKPNCYGLWGELSTKASTNMMMILSSAFCRSSSSHLRPDFVGVGPLLWYSSNVGLVRLRVQTVLEGRIPGDILAVVGRRRLLKRGPRPMPKVSCMSSAFMQGA